ncbi:MAG: S8 family serine peptidase [Clostridia bacterium]|nr:S8 family serine peptidase [Clostridia bacterium]
MSRKKRSIFSTAVSLLLSVLMVVQPSAGRVTAYAAETVQGVVSENEMPSVSDNETIVVPEVEEPIVEENEAEESAVSANETEKMAVSANEAEETIVSENEITAFSMPADYTLTQTQQVKKQRLAETLPDFEHAVEGIDYVKNEVYFLCDSQEEADKIGKAYQAESVDFQQGVAVLTINEKYTVKDVVAASADITNNLPAVWPNYINYAFDLDDDSFFTITEEDAVSEDIAALDASVAADLATEDESTAMVVNNNQLVSSEPYLLYNDEHYQWHHATVGSSYAWKAGYTGTGIKVAIVDSGVTPLTTVSDELPIAGHKDYTGEASGTADIVGHGTHVAGIIGARLNGKYGCGIAPGATLYNVRVLGDEGTGDDADIIKGINYAVNDLKVDLINMSLGGYFYSDDKQEALDNAYEAGVTVIAASGNDGHKDRAYPASQNHVISVAATDNNNQRASFSNYGSTVDLAAPGVNIWATYNNNDYHSLQGTSMACPVVTGEAAVLLSANPAIYQLTGPARVDALEKLMKANATPAGTGMGKGIISLPKALKVAVATAKPNKPIISAAVSPDKQSVSISIEAEADNTIIYSADGSTPSFVNGIIKKGFYYSSSLTLNQAKSYTIKAIAVNDSGVSSAVSTVKVTLSPFVTQVKVSGPTRVAKGKSIQFNAAVAPDYAVNKTVNWSISPADNNITVSKTGKVTVNAAATPGSYTVTATAKDASGISGSAVFEVIDATRIKSVSVINKNLISLDLSQEIGISNLKVITVDGSQAEASDFYWTSSNSAVATVAQDTSAIRTKAGGVATITALANDGSGKKATFKLTVTEKVNSISIHSNSPGEHLAAGKSKTFSVVVSPATATNKKVK